MNASHDPNAVTQFWPGSRRCHSFLLLAITMILAWIWSFQQIAIAVDEVIPPRKFKLLIVIPEMSPPSPVEESASIPIPKDAADFTGDWDWKGTDQKLEPPILHRLNPFQANPAEDSINVTDSDQGAFYALRPSNDPIEVEKPGRLTAKLFNGARLSPGVYRGILKFDMKFRPKVFQGNDRDEDEGKGPKSIPNELEISVIKCGREIGKTLVECNGKKGLEFGEPWQATTGIREWIDFTAPLSPLQIHFEIALINRQINADLPEQQNLKEIILARFGINGDDVPTFVPPILLKDGIENASLTALKELWKDVLFDPVELFGYAKSTISDTNEATYLYNSRNQKLGNGPQTWSDPVIWMGQVTSNQTADYSNEQTEKSTGEVKSTKVMERQRTFQVSFPPIDILGQVRASAKIPGDRHYENRKTAGTGEILPGFAVFPKVVVQGDYVRLFATCPVESRFQPAEFLFTRQSDSFRIPISAKETQFGEGHRFTIDSRNPAFPIQKGGEWIMSVSGNPPQLAGVPKEWPSQFRAYVGMQCETVKPILIFAGMTPMIFQFPLNSAFTKEYAITSREIPNGGKTMVQSELVWQQIGGTTQITEICPLDPVQVLRTSTQGIQFLSVPSQPSLKVFPTGSLNPMDAKSADPKPAETNHTELPETKVMKRLRAIDPLGNAFDIDVRFAGKSGKATLDDLPDEAKQSRDLEYQMPFLVRNTMHDGSRITQIIPRRINIRIRSAKDYSLDFLFWGLIAGGLGFLFCVIIGLSIRSVWMARSSSAVETLVGEDSITRESHPESTPKEWSRPYEAPTSLQTPSMESTDDERGIL